MGPASDRERRIQGADLVSDRRSDPSAGVIADQVIALGIDPAGDVRTVKDVGSRVSGYNAILQVDPFRSAAGGKIHDPTTAADGEVPGDRAVDDRDRALDVGQAASLAFVIVTIS